MRRPPQSYGKITSHHGDPIEGSFYGKHLGTDYSCPLDTPVLAPLNATVATQGWSDSVGNYIELDGEDGRRHRVLHLNKRQVANGAHVTEGQQIGLSGSTGSSSTGPHVHWDARKGGTAFGDGFENYVDTEALVTSQPPAGDGKYTIKAGDTFYALEAKNGWSHGTLQSLNPGVDPTKLQIGQVINVPGGSQSGKYTVPSPVPGYKTSADAINGVNSNSTVPAGTYDIFNRVTGAVNVTRQAGVPGWWIKG